MGTLLNFGNKILNKNQSKNQHQTLTEYIIKENLHNKTLKKLNNPKKTYRKLKIMKPKEQ